MNDPRSHGVEERHLDLLLAERLGGRRAPDVAAKVAARLEGSRPARRRWQLRTWLQAACVLLGLMVVAGIRLTMQPDGTALQQPALGPVVTVSSLQEIAALPADADHVRLTLHTPEAVRALTRLRKLRRLDASFDVEASFRPRSIERPKFFPEAARFLGMLTSLEQLDISGHAPIRGLEQLATLQRLTSLRIYYAYLDPAGLAVLQRLPRLEHLHLEATLRVDQDEPLIDLRDPAYGFVAFLEKGQLRRLTLTACITDAAGIRAIASNPLEQLHLYGLSRGQRVGRHRNALEAEAYEAVGVISTLRELSLGDSVNEKLRGAFASMPDLVKMDLGGADGLHGTEAGRAIARTPNLRTLGIEGSDIDTAALLGVTEAEGVVELELGGYEQMTDEVLAAVARMPSLRVLAMTISNRLTDAGMQVLATTKLESFSMGYTKNLSDAGVAGLPRALRRLRVHQSDFGSRSLARFDQLVELDLTFYPDDGRELFDELAESAMRGTLRKLVLRGSVAQFGSLKRLVELPALRHLDLRECKGELPPDLTMLLRGRGITVHLPHVREPAQTEVTEIDELLRIVPNPKNPQRGGR
jgi:hypothetical protein